MNAKTTFRAARSLYRRGLNPKYASPLKRLGRSGYVDRMIQPEINEAKLLLVRNGLYGCDHLLAPRFGDSLMYSLPRILLKDGAVSPAGAVFLAKDRKRHGQSLLRTPTPNLPRYKPEYTGERNGNLHPVFAGIANRLGL